MALTFVCSVDRHALARAADRIIALVSSPRVGAAWENASALPGMSIGGLARHLVSQVETAVAFLIIQPPPPHADVVSLADLYRRSDWFTAPLEAVANTSIREDFNAMAAGGQPHCMAALAQARSDLPAALAAAGPLTYVPWQDCTIATEDFIVARLMEIVVHADDLAASIQAPAPIFDEDVTHPVVALLGMLSALQHGSTAAIRSSSRAERAEALGGAFHAPPE